MGITVPVEVDDLEILGPVKVDDLEVEDVEKAVLRRAERRSCLACRRDAFSLLSARRSLKLSGRAMSRVGSEGWSRRDGGGGVL